MFSPGSLAYANQSYGHSFMNFIQIVNIFPFLQGNQLHRIWIRRKNFNLIIFTIFSHSVAWFFCTRWCRTTDRVRRWRGQGAHGRRRGATHPPRPWWRRKRSPVAPIVPLCLCSAQSRGKAVEGPRPPMLEAGGWWRDRRPGTERRATPFVVKAGEGAADDAERPPLPLLVPGPRRAGGEIGS